MTELQKRILSSVILTAVAVGSVLVGGEIFFTLLAILCVGCLYEVYRMFRSWPARVGVALYIVLGFAAAYYFRLNFGWIPFLIMSSTIVLTDIGAYMAGRTFGGPKLAPKISPTKTWAGSVGGLVLSLAFIGLMFVVWADARNHMSVVSVLIMTVIVSISAQAGDLFESWLKRRAGVKDSGTLIPGHGGLFDRLDSWIGAFIVNGIISVILLS